ncbi:spore germination protein [Tumebacillus flagellatus]|uniref:Membrane protein n=1 Tax=Tumebacillus flagellatus TaxID=1157490 RepID=A0A074LV22_9BACL|nr:spore germination protein [Tumebacillus flagellatus]KEO84804.1 membrane protein [Tumebacillus flagellatus]
MYRRFRKTRKAIEDAVLETERDERPEPADDKHEHESPLDAHNRQYVEQLHEVPVYRDLERNHRFLEVLFQDCSDIVLRPFQIEGSREALAVFVDGLIDTAEVNRSLKGMMIDEGESGLVTTLAFESVPACQIADVDNYGDLLLSVLGGDTGVFIEGNAKALLLGLRGGSTRSIAEPETEAVVRGPREGFIEHLRTNTAMLRRKLKTPNLKMKSMVVGRHTNTNVVVAFLEGIVDPATVEEVIGRIQKIQIDGVLESGYIEELIQDSTYSPFPQVQYSERPDTVAASLLEGRVAIFVDGTPFVLIAPTTFWQLLQANEDYYERFQMATLIRWLRYVFLILAMLMPSLYIAISTFHQSMLPTTLLLSVAAARETIPFPAVVEAFIMEVAFEALREAGVRLPKTVGQAVSILGALVVGQAAVQAGIVSAPMVIIVSITGIASFTIPRYNAAITFRMLRFPLMILASIFGMYGILIGVMFILGHMANLRSFGIPYLSPTGPLSANDLRDVIIRAPWTEMSKRPSFLDIQDARRAGEAMVKDVDRGKGQKGQDIPHPSEEEEPDT